jgi:5-methylcytosine-specific restriction endonuclease McrA
MSNTSPTTHKANTLASRGPKQTSLVVRSNVPSNLEYKEYKPYLRNDFFYACAYCTIAESEATGIRFTIDHYEPQSARADLVNTYDNLMYCCDSCNTYKGDRSPPEDARAKGNRFFRPDVDLRADHFETEKYSLRLTHKSTVGWFTINFLDLNRGPLLRLRILRQRLYECDQYVAEGIMALRQFPLDSLPRELRLKAVNRIKEAMLMASDIAEAIDKLLREHAQSTLLDPDIEASDRATERAKKLKDLQVMYPGTWHAERKRKKSSKRK